MTSYGLSSSQLPSFPPSRSKTQLTNISNLSLLHMDSQTQIGEPIMSLAQTEFKSPSIQPSPPGPPGGWLSSKMTRTQEVSFNATVCMVQLIPQACLTTCFPVMQILVYDFNITNNATVPWVVAAYALSFGTTILVAGRLGDIFGHRNLVVLGFSWLSFFSVLAGLSRYASYELLFVARAMQGVGSALMNPNALALLGRSYPPNSTGKIIAFSAFGLCAPLGAYTGMLGSAILGQLVHWSWSFYALAVASAVLAVIAAIVLPSPPKTPKQLLPFRQKLRSMDWLGGITGVSGLVAVQISLISAPVQGWNTPWVFMCLIMGLILILFFIVVQLKVSVEPLIPFKLLNSNVAFVLAALACGWGTFGVWTFYLWRFLLGIWNDTPLMAALHVLPIVPVAMVATALTAVLMRKTTPAWILFGALVAFTLGPTFLAANQRDSTYWTFTFLSLLVTPFGMDMSFPSATFIMSNSLPMDKQGVAGSLVTTVVNYSISLSLGLASTVEVHVNGHGSDIMDGIRGGWYFGIGLGGLGVLVCAIFLLKTSASSTTHTPRKSLGEPGPVVLIPLDQKFTPRRGYSGPFSSEDSTRVPSPTHEEAISPRSTISAKGVGITLDLQHIPREHVL